MSLYNLYRYLNDDLSDKRVSNWFLLGSPFPILTILAGYLYFILKGGPKWMKNRPAFRMKIFLLIYNLTQIIACAYLFKMVWYAGFHDGTLKFTCYDYDYDKSPIEHVYLCYSLFLLKVFDLIDTIVFVLRKKDNQITFLHIYHHVNMVIICYLGVKYKLAGPLTGVPTMLNCFIHVIMYGYYLLASFDASIQKNLLFKKAITTMQMIQFILIILHFCQIYIPSCPYIKRFQIFGYYFMGNVVMFFVLFYNFYTKAYRMNKKYE